MVLCATLLVRRGAGVAMRTVASQAKRKNAPAQAQGVFEALNREARPTVRLLDLTEGAPVPYAKCADLQTRLVALNRAELNSLQEAITKRISELMLFTLYVECDGCADIDGLGPMPVQIL